MIPRTVAILQSFRGTHGELGVSDIHRRTGLPKATVHRTLHELQKVGILERAGSRFRPGLLLFELGQLQSTAQLLRSVAVPYVENLSRRSCATAAIAMLDGIECVYLHVASSPGCHRSPRRTGGRWPAHASCSGKVLLASLAHPESVLPTALPRLTSRTTTSPAALIRELEQIRSRGIAYDNEESAPGLSGMATPILGLCGEVVGAISISRPTTNGWAPSDPSMVRQAAAAISQALRKAELRRTRMR